MLRLGGNTDRQRERVVAAFEKQKTTAEIAEILKTLYHSGNGISSVTAWYAEDGIHLSHGKSARYDKSTQIIRPEYEKAAQKRYAEILGREPTSNAVFNARYNADKLLHEKDDEREVRWIIRQREREKQKPYSKRSRKQHREWER